MRLGAKVDRSETLCSCVRCGGVLASLIGIWALASRDTFFWPIFPLVFWGIGVVMNAWDAYLAGDFSEEHRAAEGPAADQALTGIGRGHGTAGWQRGHHQTALVSAVRSLRSLLDPSLEAGPSSS